MLTMNSLKTLWVSELELETIWDLLQGYRHLEDESFNLITNLLSECGVAQSRAEALFPQYRRLAISIGKDDSYIPLKMTSDEYKFLSRLPELTQELKEIIA